MGLGVAALERYRQEETYRLWGVVYGQVAVHTNAVAQGAHNWVMQVHRIDELWAAEGKNQELRRELSRRLLENQLLNQELDRLKRLSGLGRWEGPPELEFIIADLIGYHTQNESSALVINRGRAAGVEPGDPVVWLGGLVGIVKSATDETAHVQTIVDPNSAVGAVSDLTRSRGILHGAGRKASLRFMPVNEIEPIPIGEALETGGFENSVYPRNIEIGVIERRQWDDYGIPYGVVRPSVRLDALEEVLVIIPTARLLGEDQPSTATLGQYAIRMPRDSEPMVADGDATTSPSLSPSPIDTESTAALQRVTDEPTTASQQEAVQ